jgi:hypothetical protein
MSVRTYSVPTLLTRAQLVVREFPIPFAGNWLTVTYVQSYNTVVREIPALAGNRGRGGVPKIAPGGHAFL